VDANAGARLPYVWGDDIDERRWGWPRWRSRVRSQRRRRGFDFLVEWLPRHHPELLQEDLASGDKAG
jgi:hypothetical protein